MKDTCIVGVKVSLRLNFKLPWMGINITTAPEMYKNGCGTEISPTMTGGISNNLGYKNLLRCFLTHILS